MLPRPIDVRSNTFHVSQTPPGWVTSGYGEETITGETVNIDNALKVPAVLAVFKIISEDVSSLPLILYRRLERGKERAVDHPYYALMHDAPNPEHTSQVFREIQVSHMLGWGDSFSQLIWNGKGTVTEMWPLDPSRMNVFRENGQRKYLYRLQDGRDRAFRAEEILHIPGFGYDGLRGMSVITLIANSIALGISAEKYGGRVFKNDARPSIALTLPAGKKMSEPAWTDFKNRWNATYQGSDNAAKTALLEDGMDLKTIGFPAKDSMFIEQQDWAASQAARALRIPMHMIGLNDRSTSWGSGIEQQNLGYLSQTLRPWLRRIEQQNNKDLLLSADRRKYFYEHLTEDFLRTDTTARFTAYAQAITNGWMTRNEVREKENMNPLDGLDEPLRPLNLTDGNEPSNDGDPAASSDPKADPDAVRAFVRDAVSRFMRRESNEVNDAAKRWIEKGKPEKFREWLSAFYKTDQPEFILRTMQPLKTDLRALVLHYCQQHGDQIFRAFADGDALDILTEDWQTEADQITDVFMTEYDHD